VLDQTVPPDEVIVVDDKSTDDSVSVIQTLIDGHEHVRLIENPVNLGTNGALNQGLRQSRSEYVLFLSSNDFVLPGIFARARQCLRRSPGIGLWSAMAWLVDERDRQIRLHASPVVALRDAAFSPDECATMALRFGSWFTGTTLIYRREALDDAGGFDPGYRGLSDLLTALIIASRHGAAYSPTPMAVIRLHAGSHLSGSLKDEAWLPEMLTKLRDRGPAVEPRLFTPEFLRRTELRFRFAGLRAVEGKAMSKMAVDFKGIRRMALKAVDRLVPSGWARIRVAAAFVILRPFDILITLVHRLLGTGVVLLRLRLAKKRRPVVPG
jgi:glycosyltransferase involved in cell wall biosynthesis